MELHMQSHHWQARLPDWAAAAIAGFGAGGVMMLLEVLWAVTAGGADPWRPAHMVAAMAMGWDALQTTGYSLAVVATALIIHYLLGTVFGVLLAAIVAPFRLDSSPAMILLSGALFGLALYGLNFYGMTGVFAWFTELRGWGTALGHVLFGAAAALIYLLLERPSRPR